ncbi:MAG: hypothetical protein HUU14_01370 [Dehalococcoidia bacterium]|nr:hypothetical protein [Dehalococcoidia bacterium]MCL4230064.1 hypothetical protein [Dehalococcoidia bacterium]NUQ54519.1 hypothetical protein [Dehalococcoidia bacterium]
MSTEGSDGGDLLLERLKQSASVDPAVRQLRRRYDLLRHDYELLIDRLGELEDRLTPADAPSPAPPPQPQSPPAPAPAAAGEASEGSVRESMVAPLLRLRDDYLAAAGGIQAIIAGLDSLAAAAFKGQHPAPAAGPAQAAPERPHLKATRVQVEVKGSGFGDLLDFQEKLAALPGIARVSINAIDNERASLIVELESARTPG